MDEISINPSVPVIERVNIDKSERKHCGADYRIQVSHGASIESDHSINKKRQVLGASAYMIGNRQVGLAIMLADKSALGTQTETHKSFVANHDPLEP